MLEIVHLGLNVAEVQKGLKNKLTKVSNIKTVLCQKLILF